MPTKHEERVLARYQRRKYADMLKDAKACKTVDIEYICEICGDEVDEYGHCYTCSGTVSRR